MSDFSDDADWAQEAIYIRASRPVFPASPHTIRPSSTSPTLAAVSFLAIGVHKCSKERYGTSISDGRGGREGKRRGSRRTWRKVGMSAYIHEKSY